MPTPTALRQISNLNPIGCLWAFASARVSLALLLLVTLTACESFQKETRINSAIEKSVFTRVYFASYESVWRAAQLALKYPISVNNMDNGVLETDWVRALEGFGPPGSAKIPSSGIRYKISLNMVKGRSERRESIRVTLRKNMERQRDFFSDPEVMVTDGLEETVILYRIERELIIQDALRKVAD